jgi:hypothetical protein
MQPISISANPPAPSASHRDLKVVLLTLIVLVVGYHLGLAWHGHGRFRDQHLGTALHYAATQFDLQHTIIPGFNANDAPTIQELPAWQMAAGLAFRWLGPWWGWANVVSLLLFFSALYPLFRVVQHYHGDRTAWWSLIFFLGQALVFVYAGQAGTDGFCLAVTIWFWFACVNLLARPGRWFLPAAALGTLAAVSKLPFFMAAGLAAFFLLLNAHGLKWRKLAALAGVGAISGAVFLAWTHYTEAMQAGALFPFVDLRMSGSTGGMSMVYWYFGDWHYRLNPGNWIKAGWRFGSAVFGSLPLIVLFAYPLASRRIPPAAKYFLLGGFLTTLVFTHLILHHYHYLLIYSVPVAVLCAAGLGGIETYLVGRGLKAGVIVSTAAVIILAALFQGLMTIKAFTLDPFPQTIAEAIRSHTQPTDKLVVINGGWGGEELIRTGRQGLSMWNTTVFNDREKYKQLKSLGFNKLVILSESPYQNAIQIVNPGQAGVPRQMARNYLSPPADQWPTVFANDDIIIKDIP